MSAPLRQAWCAALCACALTQPARAHEVVVIHGQADIAATARGLVDADIRVASALLQIELGPGLVVSAGQGARFALMRVDGNEARHVVIVLAEPVLAVNLALNQARTLATGSHVLQAAAAAPGSTEAGDWAVTVAAADARRRIGPAGTDVLLGDGVMVRQQAYLDSLRIDVLPLNRAIASFIRRLLSGGGK